MDVIGIDPSGRAPPRPGSGGVGRVSAEGGLARRGEGAPVPLLGAEEERRSAPLKKIGGI